MKGISMLISSKSMDPPLRSWQNMHVKIQSSVPTRKKKNLTTIPMCKLYLVDDLLHPCCPSLGRGHDEDVAGTRLQGQAFNPALWCTEFRKAFPQPENSWAAFCYSALVCRHVQLRNFCFPDDGLRLRQLRHSDSDSDSRLRHDWLKVNYWTDSDSDSC
jgi:hypothetical protein